MIAEGFVGDGAGELVLWGEGLDKGLPFLADADVIDRVSDRGLGGDGG